MTCSVPCKLLKKTFAWVNGSSDSMHAPMLKAAENPKRLNKVKVLTDEGTEAYDLKILIKYMCTFFIKSMQYIFCSLNSKYSVIGQK